MKKSSTEAFHVYLLFWFLTSYALPSINDFAVHSEIEKQLSESGLIEKGGMCCLIFCTGYPFYPHDETQFRDHTFLTSSLK